jgi:hypothetical protein
MKRSKIGIPSIEPRNNCQLRVEAGNELIGLVSTSVDAGSSLLMLELITLGLEAQENDGKGEGPKLTYLELQR